jgi:hypothetical protein
MEWMRARDAHLIRNLQQGRLILHQPGFLEPYLFRHELLYSLTDGLPVYCIKMVE